MTPSQWEQLIARHPENSFLSDYNEFKKFWVFETMALAELEWRVTLITLPYYSPVESRLSLVELNHQ